MNMMTSVMQSCQQIQNLIDDFKVIEKTNHGSGDDMDGRMDMGGGFGSGMRMGGGGGGAGFMGAFNRGMRQMKNVRRGF